MDLVVEYPGPGDLAQDDTYFAVLYFLGQALDPEMEAAIEPGVEGQSGAQVARMILQPVKEKLPPLCGELFKPEIHVGDLFV